MSFGGTMFSSIRIAMILVLLTAAGGAFLYVKNLQKNLEIAQANVAKMEVALETSEASNKLLQDEAIKNAELNKQLTEDLQKAEKYGDELRATLQKHNLTHLARKKPGLIEKRMQDATNALWDDLESITAPTTGVLDVQDGSKDSNSN